MNIVEKIRFKGNRTTKYSVSKSIYRKSYDDDFVRKIEESKIKPESVSLSGLKIYGSSLF